MTNVRYALIICNITSKIKAFINIRLAEKGIDKVLAYRNAYFDFSENYQDYLKLYNFFQSGMFDLTKIVDNLVIKDVIEKGRKYSMFPATIASFDENERK